MITRIEYLTFINKFYISRNATPQAEIIEIEPGVEVSKIKAFIDLTYDMIKNYEIEELNEALEYLMRDTEIKIKDFGIDEILRKLKMTYAYKQRMDRKEQDRLSQQNELLEGNKTLGNALLGDTSGLSKESKCAFEVAKQQHIASGGQFFKKERKNENR